ncbi:MAG: hypothetical protein ACOY90_14340 [Candidatus Zhuqueibacterota bacterium]
MESSFADVVEEIKKMSHHDKMELKFLLEKYLIEEQRAGIYKNYLDSKKEVHDLNVQYSSDINELKDKLEQ